MFGSMLNNSISPDTIILFKNRLKFAISHWIEPWYNIILTNTININGFYNSSLQPYRERERKNEWKRDGESALRFEIS